jgi:capsular exopolysaccharide synthesis family protein
VSTTELTRVQTALESAAPGPRQADFAFSPLLFTLSEPNGAQAEAIRAIRTHVMAQHIERGRRALAVCAPSRGVGCTFVATNLAVSLSQIGIKTVLIDGDLRQPGVSDLIRPSVPSRGLAGSLAASEPFSECIDYDVAPNLSVIAAGRAMDEASELLAGDRFQLLMDFCLRDFDMTIVDTPPANSSSDVRRISSVLGYSLIVAGTHRTYVNDVKTLAAQLRLDHAKVLGTVLNLV